MGRAWILDTETKGTGARMVPLEEAFEKPPREQWRYSLPPKGPPRESGAGEPRPPPRFKVIDALSRKVLVEGADARATVAALEDVRSLVDVGLYVWNTASESWRLLTHGEKQLVWSYRGRTDHATTA